MIKEFPCRSFFVNALNFLFLKESRKCKIKIDVLIKNNTLKPEKNQENVINN